ncbi:MAG: MFS transporter [Burkholderiaceae bacterium]|nr:MFS transporter [Burkholderiaceae bacterium]
MPQSPSDAAGTPPDDLSALAPLRRPVFRMLWATWLTANTCMWMSDVAAAWLMTTLTASPAWVAAVQTASTLPVFLLGLPSGALADILDRRRYFMMTQFWIAGVSTLLCVALVAGVMSAPMLLALVFLNGIGLAMRWPVFAAIVPELVPRPQLPAALALNGVAMNASRIIGPLLAGAIIAAAGSMWVFMLNALLSVVAGFTIMRWRRQSVPDPLGREPLTVAMRVGLQHVRQSRPLRAVLLRIGLFFLHSTALLALLPLVARAMPDGAAGTFTLLLAAMGIGAIVAALNMQKIRRRLDTEALVLTGASLQAVATLVMSFSPHLAVALPVMFCAGAAWITTANSMTVTAQMTLPDWVRARGMSMYQLAIMGASALGAAIWGQVASHSSVQASLVTAGVSGVITMLLAQRLMPQRAGEVLDLTPARSQIAHTLPRTAAPGRVIAQIEYLIDPAQADAFHAVMQDSRRARLSQGALDWVLLHDMSEPGRFVEQVIDVSWTEHLRRFDRFTASDVALRDRRLKFHIGEAPPRVTRYVVEEEH